MNSWKENCAIGPNRSAPQGQILEVTIDPRGRFSSDFRLSKRCLGVIIQNLGTSELYLDNIWTVKPGTTFQLILNETNILLIDLNCTFEAGGVNQAEVMLVHTNHAQYANY